MTRAGRVVSEAEFQRQVVELAQLCGFRVMHVRRSQGFRGGERGWQTTTSVDGWPDLFMWHPKRREVLVVELKSDRGRVSQAQWDVLVSLSAAGADARVWRPGDWVEVEAVLTGKAGVRNDA